jgi:hypothetical protein
LGDSKWCPLAYFFIAVFQKYFRIIKNTPKAELQHVFSMHEFFKK